jgi:hypothetical protein
VVEQTLSNWVKAKREGKLKEVGGKTGVTAEQMEISRLRAELARVTMERDILHPTNEDLSAETPAWENCPWMDGGFSQFQCAWAGGNRAQWMVVESGA